MIIFYKIIFYLYRLIEVQLKPDKIKNKLIFLQKKSFNNHVFEIFKQFFTEKIINCLLKEINLN